MDNLSKIMLEISSDEEVAFGNMKKDDDGGSVYDKEDHEWLKTLLGEVDGKKGDDGMLVKDVVPENLEKKSLQTPKPVPEVVTIDSDSDDNGGDDDCVVLDGDPDKPVLVGSAEAISASGNDSDDVEIIGEKGEVACRDFPHSRHLCAKFLFASTSHVEHCGQCHCYVCDTLAPCVHWGTGTSSIDHCHASDKEEYWRTERKKSKKGDKPAPITIKSFLSRNHQTTPASAAALPPPSSLIPSQSVVPIPMQPCSLASDVSMLDPINRFRLLRRSQSMSPLLCTASDNHISLMDMNQSMAKRSHPYFPPQAELDRNGFAGPSPNDMNAYENSLSQSQSSHEPSLKRCRTLPTHVLYGSYGSNHHNAFGSTYTPSQPQIPSGPSPNCPVRPSRPQMRSGPIPSRPIIPNPHITPGPIPNRPIRPNPHITPGPNSSRQIRPNPQMCSSPISSSEIRPSQPQICPGLIPSGVIRPSQAQIHPGPISSHPIRVPLNPRLPSQPYSTLFVRAATGQSQISSQSSATSSGNVIRSQTGSAFQASCPLPSHALASTMPSSIHSPGSQQHPKSTTSSYSGVSNTSQNQSSCNYSSLCIDGRNASQQGSELFRCAFLNQQGVQAPTDTPLLRSAAPAERVPSSSVQKDDHVQNIASADNFLQRSVLSPDNIPSLSLTDYLQFERSLYENDSLSDLLVPASPNWNEYSH